MRFGGSSWGSKIDPNRPQERINNSNGSDRVLDELRWAPQRSPSHDLSTMSTFLSLHKWDGGVIRTREPGPGGPPDTLAHASIDIYIGYLDHWKVILDAVTQGVGGLLIVSSNS